MTSRYSTARAELITYISGDQLVTQGTYIYDGTPNARGKAIDDDEVQMKTVSSVMGRNWITGAWDCLFDMAVKVQQVGPRSITWLLDLRDANGHHQEIYALMSIITHELQIPLYEYTQFDAPPAVGLSGVACQLGLWEDDNNGYEESD